MPEDLFEIKMNEDFGLSLSQARLIYAVLKTQQDPVTGNFFIEKLKESYAANSEDAKGQANAQATDVIQDLESRGPENMVEVFSKAKLNSENRFTKAGIEELLKTSYKGITDSELNGVMGLINISPEEEITVSDIQAFLKKHSTSKKVNLLRNQ